MNAHESVAMWKLYTKGLDGVAIATTVGRLKDSLQADQRRFVIGQVSYRDEESDFNVGADVEIDPLRPIFEKRLSNEHEREVRVVCTNADPPDLRENGEINYSVSAYG
jgi:hypothetical protein